MNKVDYPKLKSKFFRLNYTEAMLVARDIAGGLTPQYFAYMKEYEKRRQLQIKRQGRELVFNETIARGR